eukprot:CAMPEP_0173056854 /NCGR_PEP_ID=MMETSP1102-20130122/386_1 /TAXON_ID=49646 /ORGANISM="Geminigera sp., Strain Caron Lab Isolate" /LENGTH=247 /DNA_ID=CAMNT_0013922245 /DNA_START=1 /DNA_END=744 /DNA_ORIENTATION=-
MSKAEYVDLSGLRLDGRRPHELRKLSAKLGVVSRATGSAILDHGHTKIVASVYGPRECSSRAKEEHDRSIVNCDVFMAPFAQANRRKRTRGDRVGSEVAALIRQTFEAVLFTSVYPRSQIDITVEVLHADGPVRASAINCVTLAMIDAGLPLRDFVTACDVGYIDGHVLVDLNDLESSARGAELCVALMPNVQEVSSTHLEPKLPLDALPMVMESAMEASKEVYKLLQAIVLEDCAALAASKGRVAI